MKKLVFALISVVLFALSGCGGVQTISSGRADVAAISFVADKAVDITVSVDQTAYQVKTVKEKTYRKDRQLKKTAQNTISLTPGQHKVVVTDKAGNKIYEHIVFVSANEHKVIRL